MSLLGAIALCAAAHAQAPAEGQQPPTEATASKDAAAEAAKSEEPPAPVAPRVLPRDTPVRLMVLNEVSSRDRKPGDQFKLRVHEPVLLDGQTVIPVGAVAWGEVVQSSESGAAAQSGSLSAELSYIAHQGCRIPVEGDTSARGAKTLNAGVAFLSGGVVGLLARGNNARLKAGELVVGFTAADVHLADANGALKPTHIVRDGETPAPCP